MTGIPPEWRKQTRVCIADPERLLPKFRKIERIYKVLRSNSIYNTEKLQRLNIVNYFHKKVHRRSFKRCLIRLYLYPIISNQFWTYFVLKQKVLLKYSSDMNYTTTLLTIQRLLCMIIFSVIACNILNSGEGHGSLISSKDILTHLLIWQLQQNNS